jgi:hypothetical protein
LRSQGSSRKEDVVGLLQQNLEQEKHTLKEIKTATERVAGATAKQPA